MILDELSGLVITQWSAILQSTIYARIIAGNGELQSVHRQVGGQAAASYVQCVNQPYICIVRTSQCL